MGSEVSRRDENPRSPGPPAVPRLQAPDLGLPRWAGGRRGGDDRTGYPQRRAWGSQAESRCGGIALCAAGTSGGAGPSKGGQGRV